MVKSVTEKKVKTLIALLTEAAVEMKALGKRTTLWSKYDTCQDLGVFLEKSVERLGQGNEEDVRELWGIFAPTSDWDDSGGSMALANKIFNLLELLYREQIFEEKTE